MPTTRRGRRPAHACCGDCGLRFPADFAARVHFCPMCRGPLAPTGPAETLGHQLYTVMPGRPGDGPVS